MKVTQKAISELTLDPNNARKHSQKNLEAIAASLEKFGQRKPIVVHRGVVIAGNGTVEAAKTLGWTDISIAEVPDDWDLDTAKAYALADNRSAELAEWDEGTLAKQLLELEDSGWDIASLGFDTPELDLPEVKDDDEIPEPPVEPITKLGDIWVLGRHRLMCGDATDEQTVNRLMDGAKADMVFTDPPYGVHYTGGLQFKDGAVEKNNREMIKNDDIDIYEDVFKILAKFSNGACYVWFAGSRGASLYKAAEKYGNIHALLIWYKTNTGYSNLNANYKENKEPCLYWKPHNTTLKFIGPTTETTVWNIQKDGKNTLHPTQKPVALAVKAISNHQAKTVLDLFGGSGSTLIAAEQTNRTCYMMELDPKYCDVIVKRWETLTGQKAALLSSK